MPAHSAKDIVALLAQNAMRVVQHLLPNGKNKSNKWLVGSVGGEHGESLKVALEGDKVGSWVDYATGEGGDLLNLWCLCRNKTVSEAILEVKQWLGIPSPIFMPTRRSQYKQPEVKNEKLVQQDSKVTHYLINERKLTFATLSKFQIRETQNEIVFPFYVDGKLALLKYLMVERLDGKKKIRVSADAQPCLFGWQAIPKNARIAALTEGEIDAMSLEQYDIGFAVLSVPFGGGEGGKHNWLEHEFDRLAMFDEIYLCFDNDFAGQSAVNDLIERLGRHRCRIVTLPYKDANECLQKNVSRKEILQCFENARVLDPDELKKSKSLR